MSRRRPASSAARAATSSSAVASRSSLASRELARLTPARAPAEARARRAPRDAQPVRLGGDDVDRVGELVGHLDRQHRVGPDEVDGRGLALRLLDGGRRRVEVLDDQRRRQRAQPRFDPARGGEIEILEPAREQLAAELVAQAQQLGIEVRAAAPDGNGALRELFAIRFEPRSAIGQRVELARQLIARGAELGTRPWRERCVSREALDGLGGELPAREPVVGGGEPGAELGLALAIGGGLVAVRGGGQLAFAQRALDRGELGDGVVRRDPERARRGPARRPGGSRGARRRDARVRGRERGRALPRARRAARGPRTGARVGIAVAGIERRERRQRAGVLVAARRDVARIAGEPRALGLEAIALGVELGDRVTRAVGG